MTWKTWTVLALALILASAGIEAQRPQSPAQGRSGFQTLAGTTARAFRVPADMRLVAQERLGRGGQIAAERYRQFLGDAEVLGGQLTVYRDDAGVRDAVIGAHYADLTPGNTIRLTAGGARGIAMGRRNEPGSAWNVNLMIDPGTARYFYRVESRSVDTRWFFWIDADTGAIVNEYDGLTTGSGIGVLDDLKSLAGLTTFNGSTYRMVSSDGRQTTYDAQNRQRLPGCWPPMPTTSGTLQGRVLLGSAALVDAQFYARVTDNYYLIRPRFRLAESLFAGNGLVGPPRPELQQRLLERHADGLR